MKTEINHIEKLIGSGLYSGYFKNATGTIASFFALVLYLIPGFENPTLLIFLISILIVIGIDLAKKFEKIYGEDPKEFTLDEIIGMWISLLYLPKKIWFIIITFLLWRFMDIIKPFPIKKLELLKNGLGIILDDVLAGIYTFLIMQITINILYHIL